MHGNSKDSSATHSLLNALVITTSILLTPQYSTFPWWGMNLPDSNLNVSCKKCFAQFRKLVLVCSCRSHLSGNT